jgi:hypothetical protein
MKVKQFEGKNGAVRNQFILIDDAGNVFFQSYDSIIVKRCTNGDIFLDEETWDYSITTGKYRNQFLNETKKETERKIKAGVYKLAQLN